jgi:hypothetical protein
MQKILYVLAVISLVSLLFTIYGCQKESGSTTESSTPITTGVQTTLEGIITEVQYEGMAEWDFVISQIILTASSTEINVKFNVNSMYQKTAYIKAQFLDKNDTILGTSSNVEVRIMQAGTVKSAKIEFPIDNVSKVKKCILLVSE